MLANTLTLASAEISRMGILRGGHNILESSKYWLFARGNFWWKVGRIIPGGRDSWAAV